jgi:hypothetical protein
MIDTASGTATSTGSSTAQPGLDLIPAATARAESKRRLSEATSDATKALTNAERQRRHRQRAKSNACDCHERNERNERNALTVTSPVPRVTSGDVMVLCASQDKIEIAFDDDGDAIITQTRWPDEDQTIIVSRDNLDTFIDKLTDAFGIPSFGR